MLLGTAQVQFKQSLEAIVALIGIIARVGFGRIISTIVIIIIIRFIASIMHPVNIRYHNIVRDLLGIDGFSVDAVSSDEFVVSHEVESVSISKIKVG